MRWQIVCAVTVVALAISEASGADKVKEDLKKLQGEWPVVIFEMRGRGGKIEHINNKLVFDGEKLTIYRVAGAGKAENWSYSVKLDPTASPKTIDLTHLDGNAKGQVVQGVYEVADNELSVCIAPLNKPRPDGLNTSSNDPGWWLYKCKRPKKPDEAIAKERKKLNGTWTLVLAFDSQGGKMPQRTLERMKYVLSDGKLTGFFDGKEGDKTCTYELVDIKSDPKKIDLREINKFGAVINKLGIYKLDGDELTICMDDETAGRPTAFEPKTRTALFTLKRQKP